MAQDALSATDRYIEALTGAEAATEPPSATAGLSASLPGISPRSIALMADRGSPTLSAGRANPSLRADRT